MPLRKISVHKAVVSYFHPLVVSAPLIVRIKRTPEQALTMLTLMVLSCLPAKEELICRHLILCAVILNLAFYDLSAGGAYIRLFTF